MQRQQLFVRWLPKNMFKKAKKEQEKKNSIFSKNCLSNKNVVNGKTNTYLETLNGANDMSADPLAKSPMIPLHCSAAR